MNKSTTVFLTVLLFLITTTVCFSLSEPLENGIYSAVFTTDSSMFKVCEAHEDRGTLTVKDGVMTIHVSLYSKNILNLYPGFAKDAKKEGAELLEPSTDKVTYSDGFEDTVYGFDIPVPYLNEEFDLALVGKKGKWYDHKVSVSDPIFISDLTGTAADTILCSVTLKGGSGKASVQSPAAVTVNEQQITATVIWSSPYYEFMLVDDVRYEPIQSGGNSTFEIPVVLDTDMPVSASTVAMSQPHLIGYTLHFDCPGYEETAR